MHLHCFLKSAIWRERAKTCYCRYLEDAEIGVSCCKLGVMDEDTRRIEERLELERRFSARDFEFIDRFFTPNISTEEFLKLVAAGEKEFVDICLKRPNLTGINLAGANLTGAKLLSANLIGANLSGANLSYAFLDGANLSGVNLEGANVNGADIVEANLENANLRGTTALPAIMQYSFSPCPSPSIASSFEGVPHSCRKCCIGSFGHAHRAFYHNTILRSGEICVDPYWEEG